VNIIWTVGAKADREEMLDKLIAERPAMAAEFNQTMNSTIAKIASFPKMEKLELRRKHESLWRTKTTVSSIELTAVQSWSWGSPIPPGGGYLPFPDDRLRTASVA